MESRNVILNIIQTKIIILVVLISIVSIFLIQDKTQTVSAQTVPVVSNISFSNANTPNPTLRFQSDTALTTSSRVQIAFRSTVGSATDPHSTSGVELTYQQTNFGAHSASTNIDVPITGNHCASTGYGVSACELPAGDYYVWVRVLPASGGTSSVWTSAGSSALTVNPRPVIDVNSIRRTPSGDIYAPTPSIAFQVNKALTSSSRVDIVLTSSTSETLTDPHTDTGVYRTFTKTGVTGTANSTTTVELTGNNCRSSGFSGSASACSVAPGRYRVWVRVSTDGNDESIWTRGIFGWQYIPPLISAVGIKSGSTDEPDPTVRFTSGSAYAASGSGVNPPIAAFVFSEATLSSDEQANVGNGTTTLTGNDFIFINNDPVTSGVNERHITGNNCKRNLGNTAQVFDCADVVNAGTYNIYLRSNYTASIGTAWIAATGQTITPVPDAPSTPDLHVDSDEGSSDTDNLTNDATPTITVGGVDEGNIVTVTATKSGSDAVTKEGTVGSGETSIDITLDTLAAGTWSITASQSVGSGTESASSSALSITIDTTVPSTPIVTLATDTGSSNSDGVTTDATINVTNVEANASWDYRKGTSGAWQDGTGSSFEAEDNATNTYYVRVVDVAGNISNFGSKQITVDTDSPTSLTRADITANSDNCVPVLGGGCAFGSRDDNITNAINPIFGRFTNRETGSNVTITLTKGSDIRQKSSTSNPTFLGNLCAHTDGGTENQSCDLSDGVWSVSAVQTDVAGNSSSAFSAGDLTIDTQAPNAPTIDLQAGSDSGSSNSDNLTKDTTPTFDVTHSESEEVYSVYYTGTSGITSGGAGAIASGGTKDYTAAALGNGETTLRVVIFDKAGNTSSEGTLKVHIDTTTPEATVTLDSTKDSGVASDRITNETDLKFDFANLESSADPTGGTGKANITVTAEKPDGTEVTIHEITDASATTLSCTFDSTDTSTTACSGTNPFADSDGVYKVKLTQTDDAGNVTETATGKIAYNASTGTKGDNVIIIDTTAPEAPPIIDLSPTDDSHSENPNRAKTGTDNDDITNITSHSYFAGVSNREVGDSSDLTGGALTRENHHILVYRSNTLHDVSAGSAQTAPSGSDPSTSVGTNPAETAVSNVSTINSFPTSGTGNGPSLPGRIPSDYDWSTDVGTGTDKYVYVFSKQRDAAGNESDYSPIKRIQIDRELPAAITPNIHLHPLRDTGDSRTDQQTAATNPVFRTPGSSSSDDIDFYEARTIEYVGEDFITTGSYEYRSSTTTTQQGSYNYVAGNTQADLDALTGAYTGDYDDGVTVVVDSLNLPKFNTWYGFKIYSVDVAGNVKQSVNENNVKILIPPPTPETLDLEEDSDTCANVDADTACESGTKTDNLTNLTTITLDGRFGNGLTTTGAQATEERDSNAAEGVQEIRIRVEAPDGGTEDVILNINREDAGESDVVVPANANDAYTFEREIDLETLFPSLTSYDGVWRFTATGISSGDQGGSSPALSVTIDQTNPVAQSTEIKVNSFSTIGNQSSSGYSNWYGKHVFFLADDSTGAIASLFTAETGGSSILTIDGEEVRPNATGVDIIQSNSAPGQGTYVNPNYRSDFSYFIE